MWRAELNSHIVITGGGDEEEMQDIINEIISLEIEINKSAQEYFRVQKRPINMRVQLDLRDTHDRIKVFSNPKFKAPKVHRYVDGEEPPNVNIDR